MSSPIDNWTRRDSGLSSVDGSDSSKRASKRVTFGEVTEIPAERRRSKRSAHPKSTDHLKQTSNAVKRLSRSTSYHSSLPHELSRQSLPKDYHETSHDRHNYRDSIVSSYRHVPPMNVQKTNHATPEPTQPAARKPDDKSSSSRSRSQGKPMTVRITYVIRGGRDSPTAGNRISVR